MSTPRAVRRIAFTIVIVASVGVASPSGAGAKPARQVDDDEEVDRMRPIDVDDDPGEGDGDGDGDDDDDDAVAVGGDVEPAGDGEGAQPRLIEARDDDEPATERALHHRQIALALQVGTGLRFIKPYDDEYCGERGEGGEGGAAEYCMGRSPVTLDLVAAYGVLPHLELMLELRFGLEREFGGTPNSDSGPRIRRYAPGVKVYFSESGMSTFFSTAQLVVDTTGYQKPDGSEIGTDYALRNVNGLQLDFDRAFGLYFYFAETFGVARWLQVEMEGGIGFQGRYP